MPKLAPRREWRPAFHSKNIPIQVPEPQFRVVDRGPTANISFRAHEIPTSNSSSAQQIKDICLHYVSKCSGQYLYAKTAARYVHQMADEVLNQISGLISQIGRIEAEPEAYQKLLQEFKEAFPTSVSSPKAVAMELANLKEENTKLLETVQNIEQNYEKRIKEISSSFDTQIVAFKDGVLKERRHFQSKVDGVVDDFTKLLDAERAAMAERENLLQSAHAKKVNDLTNSHLSQLVNLQNNEVILKQTVEELRSELLHHEDLLRQQDIELSVLRNKIRRYEDDELISIDKGTLASARSYITDDDRSIDSAFTNDPPVTNTSVDNPLQSQSQSTQQTVTNSNTGSYIVAGTETDMEAMKGADAGAETAAGKHITRPRKLASASRYANIARSLKKRLLKAEVDVHQHEKINADLRSELKTLQDDYNILKLELRDCQSINLALKKALRNQAADKENTKNTVTGSSQQQKQRSQRQDVHPLCHTPHFLTTDRNGLTKNPKQHSLTGYATAGHF